MNRTAARRARRTVTCLWAVAAACRHGPPPAVMPEPGQLARIRHLRIVAPAAACPGKAFATTYDGQLDDGSFLPHRLPAELLLLSSPDATPFSTGDWTPSADPLASVTSGFPIAATLRASPGVTDTIVIPPEYSCLPRTLRFRGAEGNPGARGGDGPPVTVRLGFLRTPYFPTLLVAAIRVADRPPFYLFADASKVLPGEWLTIESVGGAGGWGVTGTPGRDGASGEAGCPGSPGGAGEDGGAGGPGGQGGQGGAVTIVGPDTWPLFTGLVDVRSTGGPGGRGGPGGVGGQGGNGGLPSGQAAHGYCQHGPPGASGARGPAGRDGASGASGPPPRIVALPPAAVLGDDAPTLLRSLLLPAE